MTCPEMAINAARATLKDDTKTLAVSRAALQKALAQPDATDAELAAACTDIEKQVKTDPSKVKTQALACLAYTNDAATVAADQAALAWDIDWAQRRANVRRASCCSR